MQDGSADSFQELLEAIMSPSSLFEFDTNVFQAALVGKLDVTEVACRSVYQSSHREQYFIITSSIATTICCSMSLLSWVLSQQMCVRKFISLEPFMSCSSQHLRSHMPGL